MRPIHREALESGSFVYQTCRLYPGRVAFVMWLLCGDAGLKDVFVLLIGSASCSFAPGGISKK